MGDADHVLTAYENDKDHMLSVWNPELYGRANEQARSSTIIFVVFGFLCAVSSATLVITRIIVAVSSARQDK